MAASSSTSRSRDGGCVKYLTTTGSSPLCRIIANVLREVRRLVVKDGDRHDCVSLEGRAFGFADFAQRFFSASLSSRATGSARRKEICFHVTKGEIESLLLFDIRSLDGGGVFDAQCAVIG